MRKNIRIGEILIEDGLITAAQLEMALEKQQTSFKGKKLGNILIELGYVTEIQFIQCLSKRLKIPFVNLKNYPISDEVTNLLDEQIARKHNLVPIARKDNLLTIAMSDPMNLFAIEEVKLATKMQVNTVISTKEEIRSIINRCYSGQKALSAAEQLAEQYSTKQVTQIEGLLNIGDIENAPIVKMINSIMLQGIQLGASDIHIEAEEDKTRVRMRIDGQLQEKMHLNKNSHEAIITRLKIMANMDIAEKRVPQDGRCEIPLEDKKVDVRVASMPTINGEKIVIRILNSGDNILLSKNELGLTPHNLKLFERMLKSPYGIILVTGPTGSGKSTTLYTILNEINTQQDNIITLEDPVEKKIPGINQIHINPKAGLTFANGLRAILRQDPNVIMVGEIRDSETADIAIKAAITGHLVFSTLHTNDAISTVARLVDMGIEPYLVSSAIVGVIAQRLTRIICPQCKTEYLSTEQDNEVLEIEESISIYRGVGCQHCNFTGYKGRRAIHEVLLLDSEFRQMINKNRDIETLKKHCKEKEMQFLKDHMKSLVLEGQTTVDELIKITYSLD